jgi:hypothetical protein
MKSLIRNTQDRESLKNDEFMLAPHLDNSLALPSVLEAETAIQLQRMFRDPRVLEHAERADLIASLRRTVDLVPHVPELRVMLGMALCVDLQAQQAMEELRIAVAQDPDCFVAQLKFGELLMRLRICDQAAEHTHKAAQLASNSVQSELARRQAAAIRTMQREGIERGGYKGLFGSLGKLLRRSKSHATAPVFVGSK